MAAQAKAKKPSIGELQAKRVGIDPAKTYTCRMTGGHTHLQGHPNRPIVRRPGEEFDAPGHEIAGLGFRVEIKVGGAWAHFPKLVEEQESLQRGELAAVADRVRAATARLHRAILHPQARVAIEQHPLPTHLAPFIPSPAKLAKVKG